jgi:DNA modification methylase
MTIRLMVGDALDLVQQLEPASVHTVVTSPPYFALRDYGVPPSTWPELEYVPVQGLPPITVPAMTCPLGLETDPLHFIGHLVHLFRGVARVLRPDGTLWLNLGDSVASSGGIGAGSPGRPGRSRASENPRGSTASGLLRPKNLIGIPWRAALALQADGWILRQDIIWHKKTPMPETAKDRPTRAHEYVFLFARQRYYHYDAAAIAEPCSEGTHARMAQNVEAQAGSTRANGGQDPRPMKAGGRNGVGWGYGEGEDAKPRFPPPVGTGTRAAQREARQAAKAPRVPTGWDTGEGGHRELAGRYAQGLRTSEAFGREPGWRGGPLDRKAQRAHREAGSTRNNASYDAAMATVMTTRNKRSVWTLGPEPFKGAHYSTFPTALVEPCILAGCPEGGTVLDVFGGSGTTGIVADRHHRHAILMELDPKSAELARRRISDDAPLLARIEG